MEPDNKAIKDLLEEFKQRATAAELEQMRLAAAEGDGDSDGEEPVEGGKGESSSK